MGTLVALVDQNKSTSTELVALNLHEAIIEDAVRRWPNNAELCCVSCWVLRSILPAIRHPDSKDLHEITTKGLQGLEGQIEGKELGNEDKRDNSDSSNNMIKEGIEDEDGKKTDKGAEGTLERLIRLSEETKVRPTVSIHRTV